VDQYGDKLLPPRLNLAWFSDHFVPFMDLTDVVATIIEMVENVRIVNDIDAQQAKRKMIVKQGRKISEDVISMISAEDHVQVRWVDVYQTRKGEDTWKVCTSPVDIAPFMKAAFWEEKTSVIMSATLSSGTDDQGNKDFTYMKRTLGLTEGKVAAVDVGSPFDFPNQALMFVPDKDIPNPKSDRAAWMGYAMSTFLQIVQITQGGVLSLYTSRNAMEESYKAMAPMLRDAGYTVLMQGNREEGHQYSNRELAEIFKIDTHSILFGLETFFTGVDFLGDACRAVVLDKLPFPVPSDPIFEARELAEKRAGRRPFNSLSIPMMMLTLEQAQGRLIRTVKDTGLFAVLDSRLTSTPYGRGIVKALPDFPVTTEMAKVREFYARTRG
jgi:ATP-dependent DNA helicase DinG